MKKLILSKYILTAVMFLALSGGMGAWGAAYTWTGGAAGVWENTANWSGGVIPGSSDTVTINTAATITTSTPITVTAIKITAGATFNLGANLTVTGDNWDPNNNLDFESNGVTINLNGHTLLADMTLYAYTTPNASVTINGTGAFTTTSFDASDTNSTYTTMTNGVVFTVTNLAYLDYVVNYFSGDGTCTAAFPNGMGSGSLVQFDNVLVQNGANTYTLNTAGAIAAGQTVIVTLGGTFTSTVFSYIIDVGTPTGGESYAITGVTTPSTSINDASGTVTTTASSFSFNFILPASVAAGHGATLTVTIPGATTPIAIGSIQFIQNASDTAWIGGSGGNAWNVAANWTNGMPDNTHNATIPQIANPANYPVITAAGAETGTLVIDSGATLTLGTQGLAVTTSVTNNGTISLDGTAGQISGTHTSGLSSTIVYTGAAAVPTAWGSNYRNLTVDPGAILSLGGTNVTVAGTLENNGTIVVNGAGTINKSDSSGGTFQYSAIATTSIPTLSGYNILDITNGARVQTNNFSANTLIIGAAASLTVGTSTLTVNTALTNNNLIVIDSTGTISRSDPANGTFQYSGTCVSLPDLNGYRNVEIDVAGTISAAGNLAIGGNLVLTGGVFQNGANTVSVTGSVSGAGTLTGGAGTITVGSGFTPANFSQSGGTLELDGTVGSFAPTGTIGSLTLGASANVTLGSDITLTGNFNNSAGGTFSANSHAVNFMPTTTSVISGTTTFYDLTCAGQGGKTLTVNSGVTVSNNLTLTGSGTLSRLSVNGAGSVALPSAQTSGQYLSVEMNTMHITGFTYTAYESIPTTTRVATSGCGWILASGTTTQPTWLGYVSNVWTDGGNWDTGVAPIPGDTVTIPAPAGTFTPLADAAIDVASITITGTVDFAAQSVTVTSLTNNGSVSLAGASGQIVGIPTITNGAMSTVTYTDAAATASSGWGTTYQNLTIAGAGHLTLGTTSITVNGTLDNNGIIEINDSGIINKTDSTGGIFRYSTVTGTIPVTLTAYNVLEIYSGNWSASATTTTTSITVYPGATFDLNTRQMNVAGPFANNGTVMISGSQTIGGTKSNGGSSTVEYYGAGMTPTSWGTAFQNLTVSAGSFSAGPGLAITGNLVVSGSASATFNANAGQTTNCATADFTGASAITLCNDAGDHFDVTAGSLTLSSAGTPTFGIAGFLSASTGINLGNNVTINASTTFSSAVTLTGASPVTLALGTNSLTFNSTFVGGAIAFVTTGTGAVIANGSFGSSSTGNDEFYDLTIGGAFTCNGNILVMHNFTVQNSGSFTNPNPHTLTLGGSGSAAGNITDNRLVPVSLGSVTINAVGATTKTAATDLVFELLTITAGPFTSGIHNITAASVAASGQTWNASGGTIDVNGDCNIGTLATSSPVALNITGNATFSTVMSGTNVALTLDGTGAQAFTTGGNTFGSVAVTTNAGPDTITVNNALIVNGALTVDAGQILSLVSTLSVGGTATNAGTISGGTSMDFNGDFTGGGTLLPAFGLGITFAADVTFGSFTANGSTVTLDGNTVSQSINLNNQILYNLTIGNHNAALLVDFTNPLQVTNIWLVTGPNTYNITLGLGGSSTQAVTFANTGTLTISSGFTFSGGVTATDPIKNITGTISVPSGNLDFTNLRTDVSGSATIDCPGTIALAEIDSTGATDRLTITNGGSTTTITGRVGTTTALDALIITAKTGGSVTFSDGEDVSVNDFQTGTGNYAINILSTTANFTRAGGVTFNNTGTLTLGDDGSGTDTLTFTNGVTATAPTNKNIAAIVQATTGTAAINLGGNSTTITANSRIGGSATGSITLAAVFIDAGATLTLGNNAASPVTTGTIAGSVAGASVFFNTSATTVSTIAGIGINVGTLSITHVGSGGLTFSGTVGTGGSPVGSVVFSNTIASAGTIAFSGAVTAAGMTVNNAAGLYNVEFNGGGTISGGAVNFNNGGTLTLGNDSSDTISFANGLSTGAATRPSAKNIAGNIQATAGAISLTGTLTTVTDTATIGGSSSGNISLSNASITAGETLTIGAGSANTITASAIDGLASSADLTINVADTAIAGTIGQIGANIGTFQIQQSGGITVTGTTAANIVTLTDTASSRTVDFQGNASIGTLNTANQGYNVRFGGGGAITGGAATTFDNTGTLTIASGFSFPLGVTHTAGDTDLSGTIATTNTPVNLASLSLGGTAAIDTVNSGTGGNITIGAISNTSAQTLDLTAGTAGDIDISGAVGSVTALGAITVVSADTTRFQSTINALSLTQSAGNGTTTFQGNVTTSGATAVDVTTAGSIRFDNALGTTVQANGAAAGTVQLNAPVTLVNGSLTVSTTNKAISCTSTINGAQTLILDAGTAVRQPVTVSAAIGATTALSSLSIDSSAIDLHGIGNLIQNGVTNTVTARATGIAGITLHSTAANGGHYKSGDDQLWTAASGGVRYVSGEDGTWTASAGTITLNTTNTDLYLDHAWHTLTIGCAFSCRDLIFYNGTLSLGASQFDARNLAAFGSGYNADDHEWDEGDNGLNITTDDTRFAYYFPSDPLYTPAGCVYNTGLRIFTTLVTTPQSAQFAFSTSAITVSGNFYDNGVTSTGTCTLTTPSNASSHPTFHYGDSATANQWGIPYAVAFYMNGTGITVNPTGGYLAGGAAQGVTTTGLGNWQAVRPLISTVETVYDDVIHVTFNMLIENSHGEIHEAIYHATAPTSVRLGGAWFNAGSLLFAEVYKDPNCNDTLEDTDGDVLDFYIKTAGGRWNTDAMGTSTAIIAGVPAAGNADSTDRGRGATAAAHRTTVPDLSFLEGLFYAADGKTMCANYGANTALAYTATTDHCAPVLVSVMTGQEAHTAADNDAAQLQFDAHNFIEFRWSEPVDIPGVLPSDVNILATPGAGAITVSGSGIDIAGLGTIAAGTVTAGEKAYGATSGGPSTTCHALYRTFSLDGTAPTSYIQRDCRLRVSIAGHALLASGLGATGYQWYWPGYIESATTPTGAVTNSATLLAIDDRSAANNALAPFNILGYPRADVSVSTTDPTLTGTPAVFYGPWDTKGPVPVALRTSTDAWGDPITAYEAVPDASGGVIDRIEMHFFDNPVNYNLSTDTYAWLSKKGWYLSTDLSKTTLLQTSAAAPESFGGSRSENSPTNAWVPTSGGIRECSLDMAIGGFRVFYNDALMTVQPATFSTNVSTKLLAPLSNQNVAGDPYFRLYWLPATPSGRQIAGSTIKVSYNTDSPANTGYITDLAGNIMPYFSKITCVDRTAPRITFSLAGANRNDLYVLFSKSIEYTNLSELAPGLTVTLGGTEVALSGTPESKSANNRAFLYHLGSKVRATDLVNASSSIVIRGTGNIIIDPVTTLPSETSYFVDAMGNYAVVGDTHRLTDIGIGLTEILYGSDGVNEPGLLGGQKGALRSESFDGTGRLLDKDITIATWINLPTAPDSLALYYDVSPSADTMPKSFNDATGSSLALWLPSVLPGFNLSGNQEARNLSPTVITDSARLFRNFLIPESDSEIVPGSKVELVMQYEGLFCARLTDQNDITSLAPWSFVVAETRHQRGGVTILNNVIDSNKREKTIVQVEVPKAGNVVIQVFTLDGNIVKVLERGRKGGGTYSYYWDGTNGAGNPVARGIYFIRVVGPDMDEIRKVLVVKD